MGLVVYMFCFFKQKTAYEMRISDWSSDVCSSDLLLDQRLIAGLGNIYVCEALYRARLSPVRPAGTVTGARAARLATGIRSVPEAATAAGGPAPCGYVQASGQSGYFTEDRAVGGRDGEPCQGCDLDIGTNGGGQAQNH